MITKRAEIAINFFSLFLDQRFEISFARNITLTRKLVVIIFNSNTIDTFLRTVVFHSASYIFTSATTYIYIFMRMLQLQLRSRGVKNFRGVETNDNVE